MEKSIHQGIAMTRVPGTKLEQCCECEYEWWHKVYDIEEIETARCPNCGEYETETIDVRAQFED